MACRQGICNGSRVTHEICWHPLARDDLYALYDWIAEQADPDTAYNYTTRIEVRCAGLADYPEKGTPRDDFAPGIRTMIFERRVVIAYRVEGSQVVILRVVSGARDISGIFDQT